jgi:ribosome-binding factor A
MARPQRLRRIEDQIQRELSELLHSELKDPRVGLVTLTGVEVSSDLTHAKVFFTTLGDDKARAQCIEGIARATGFLRSQLGRRIDLRVVPELHFHYDASVEHGMKLSRLIDEANAGPKAE